MKEYGFKISIPHHDPSARIFLSHLAEDNREGFAKAIAMATAVEMAQKDPRVLWILSRPDIMIETHTETTTHVDFVITVDDDEEAPIGLIPLVEAEPFPEIIEIGNEV